MHVTAHASPAPASSFLKVPNALFRVAGTIYDSLSPTARLLLCALHSHRIGFVFRLADLALGMSTDTVRRTLKNELIPGGFVERNGSELSLAWDPADVERSTLQIATPTDEPTLQIATPTDETPIIEKTNNNKNTSTHTRTNTKSTHVHAPPTAIAACGSRTKPREDNTTTDNTHEENEMSNYDDLQCRREKAAKVRELMGAEFWPLPSPGPIPVVGMLPGQLFKAFKKSAPHTRGLYGHATLVQFLTTFWTLDELTTALADLANFPDVRYPVKWFCGELGARDDRGRTAKDTPEMPDEVREMFEEHAGSET